MDKPAIAQLSTQQRRELIESINRSDMNNKELLAEAISLIDTLTRRVKNIKDKYQEAKQAN